MRRIGNSKIIQPEGGKVAVTRIVIDRRAEIGGWSTRRTCDGVADTVVVFGRENRRPIGCAFADDLHRVIDQTEIQRGIVSRGIFDHRSALKDGGSVQIHRTRNVISRIPLKRHVIGVAYNRLIIQYQTFSWKRQSGELHRIGSGPSQRPGRQQPLFGNHVSG